jgi:DNA (cytosine-5)-methyltransferase 1
MPTPPTYNELIKIGSDYSGVGSFPQALKRLGIKYEESFSCDYDYFARCTYLLNFGTSEDIELSKTKDHKYYADLVKSFALGTKVSNKENELLNEANDFAKKFSFYYPFNIYQREIPKKPEDIYVSTPPCQSFS